LGYTYEQKIIFSFGEEDCDDILDECIVEVPVYQGKLAYSLKKEEEKENV